MLVRSRPSHTRWTISTSWARSASTTKSIARPFAHEFKTALDLTAMEFVAYVRLDLAHRMLLTTGMPVEGIAAAVGFSSRSHFSHLFREHYGTDPSTFRRCEKQGFPRNRSGEQA